MCGLLGIINYKDTITPKGFEAALDIMLHRGPDGSGIFTDENVMLGHRRLSIIDLSEHASQPFISVDQKVKIVFNGEIYNYREISDGLPLRTTSDTEVLLEGYIRDGIEFFKKLRGIYAFHIYDTRTTPKCIMVRDQAGVKPFYYTQNANGFIFASEIKSILPLLDAKPKVNNAIIRQYIHLGYCPEPETAYTNIFALEPGHCMLYDVDAKSVEKIRLFEYDFSDLKMSEKEAMDTTERLLKKACERNMVADVKVNVALSGGIDSSLVYAYSNEASDNHVTGITIKFDEKAYDESEVAAAYAKHLNAPHQIETTEVTNRFDLLNQLLLHFDQPYADSSFIPFYFLCNAAAKHSKVLIGGDSGDEIHNGYAGHKTLPLLEKLRGGALKYPALMALAGAEKMLGGERKRFARKLKGLMNTKDLKSLIFYWESWFPPDVSMYPFNPFNYNPADVVKVLPDGATGDVIEYNYFFNRMLSDYLRKSDMMSMLNSLEFRVPMLDEDLTAFSLRIPYEYKSDRKQAKKILRALHRNTFPEEFSKLKKKGFTIPLDTWLGPENLDKMKKYLLEKDGIVTQFITKEYITYLFDAIGNAEFNNYISRPAAYQRILILYSLELWYQHDILG